MSDFPYKDAPMTEEQEERFCTIVSQLGRKSALEKILVGGQATHVQCPWCGYQRMHYSGTPDSPSEVTKEFVKCDSCGHITDYWEAYKKWQEMAPESMTKEQISP